MIFNPARILVGFLLMLAAAFLPESLSAPAGASSFHPPLSRGKFLVASRDMQDPRFRETVILIIQHNSKGTVGIAINRPSDLPLARVLPKIGKMKRGADNAYYGGPMNQSSVFLLIRSAQRTGDAERVFGDVWVSSNTSVLTALLADTKSEFRAYVGYAGWALGQADAEISAGQWHVVNADVKSVFEKKSSDIWPALISFSGSQWVRATGTSMRSTARSF